MRIDDMEQASFIAALARAIIDGTHRHKCCGLVWEHGHEMAGNDAAHTCPRCGSWVSMRHMGEREVTVCLLP